MQKLVLKNLFFPSNVQILMSALVLQPMSVTPMPGVQTLKVLTAAAVFEALKGTAKTVQVKKMVSVISQTKA